MVAVLNLNQFGGKAAIVQGLKADPRIGPPPDVVGRPLQEQDRAGDRLEAARYAY